MADMNKHRFDGMTCTTSNGHPIIWKGHLCEGANLTDQRNDNFCLWTRCGKHDVPANAAHEGTTDEVDCDNCLDIDRAEYDAENGPRDIGDAWSGGFASNH